MTTARVIPFYPHAVGRPAGAGGREPVSPFEHLMERRTLTARQIVHRRQMLMLLYAKRADRKVGPYTVAGRADLTVGPYDSGSRPITADRRAESTTGRG